MIYSNWEFEITKCIVHQPNGIQPILMLKSPTEDEVNKTTNRKLYEIHKHCSFFFKDFSRANNILSRICFPIMLKGGTGGIGYYDALLLRRHGSLLDTSNNSNELPQQHCTNRKRSPSLKIL